MGKNIVRIIVFAFFLFLGSASDIDLKAADNELELSKEIVINQNNDNNATQYFTASEDGVYSLTLKSEDDNSYVPVNYASRQGLGKQDVWLTNMSFSSGIKTCDFFLRSNEKVGFIFYKPDSVDELKYVITKSENGGVTDSGFAYTKVSKDSNTVYPCWDFNTAVNEENEYIIILGNKSGLSGDISIPVTIDDVPVRKVEYFFVDGGHVTTLNYPEGVVDGGSVLTSDADNSIIDKINYPKTLTKIEIQPTATYKIEFPEGNEVFNVESDSLLRIMPSYDDEIPNGKSLVYYMGTDATSYTVPSGVTEVEGYSFASAKKLKTITLPNSVDSLRNEVFYSGNDLNIICENGSTDLGISPYDNGGYRYFAFQSILNEGHGVTISAPKGGMIEYYSKELEKIEDSEKNQIFH